MLRLLAAMFIICFLIACGDEDKAVVEMDAGMEADVAIVEMDAGVGDTDATVEDVDAGDVPDAEPMDAEIPVDMEGDL